MHVRVRWRIPCFRAGPQSTAPLATFPQASLRSRTAGFPQSGSDLGCPAPPAHGVRNAPPDSEHAPHSRGLPAQFVPSLRTRQSWLKVQGRPGTAKCPEFLRPRRALPPAERCPASPGPALPGRHRYYEPMRQSSSLTTASVGEPCAAGLCRLSSDPAGMSTFPTLSPQSLSCRLDPYPGVFLRCLPVSSRRTAASP